MPGFLILFLIIALSNNGLVNEIKGLRSIYLGPIELSYLAEITSKLQRLNLEYEDLFKQEQRTKEESEKLRTPKPIRARPACSTAIKYSTQISAVRPRTPRAPCYPHTPSNFRPAK